MFFEGTGNFSTTRAKRGKRPFLAHLQRDVGVAICSRLRFADEENKMANENGSRAHYGEAFWRAHHEAWRRSDLNQQEYCKAEGISLKAFGNWRAKFRSEPQPPARKLLYWRGGVSHTPSHSLSHPLSHVTCPSSPLPDLIVPPAREGHRRSFSDVDRRRILVRRSQTRALPRSLVVVA
jgi:hypothetical protein